MPKRKTKKFICAANMPPLHHTVPGEKFDILHSPAVHWLIRQPSIAQFIFDKAREFLVYDAQTGTWQGVDYVD